MQTCAKKQSKVFKTPHKGINKRITQKFKKFDKFLKFYKLQQDNFFLDNKVSH